MKDDDKNTPIVSDIFGLQSVREVLDLVYPDLLQPAAKQLGKNLKTIIEYLSLPLLRIRFAVAERKLIYKKRLEMLLSELNRIPDEKHCEIPSSIAAPALDQLSIESDEDISKLFIRLLVNSSSRDTIRFVHPSFINCIRNLSSDEAKLLKHLDELRNVPYLKIRIQFNEKEGLDKSHILTGFETHLEFSFPENIPLYLDNLVGLGILSKGEGTLSDIDKWYAPLMKIYESARRQIEVAGHSDGQKYPVVFQMGFFEITSYGRLFLKACMQSIWE